MLWLAYCFFQILSPSSFINTYLAKVHHSCRFHSLISQLWHPLLLSIEKIKLFSNVENWRVKKFTTKVNLELLIILTEHSAASSFGRSLRGAWQIKYSSHIFRYWTLKVQQTTAFRNGKKVFSISFLYICTYLCL